LFDELADGGEDYVAGVDRAQDWFALVGADCYEIHAGVGIIVIR
jgi:hypothetical protein